MKSVVINLSLFKIAWLVTVFAAAASVPIAGALAIAAAVAVHLARADSPRAEALLLVSAAIIGLAWESAMVAAGILAYDSGLLLPGFAPYWIVAMWVLFATTLNVGMRWLQKSTLVAAIAGAIGGPMSFLAGQKAGAVSFADTTLSLLVVGAGWAVLLPALVGLARRLAAVSHVSPRSALLTKEHSNA